MIRIFIDADACPVRKEAMNVADRHKLQVYVVSNGGIRPDPHPLVETVIVPDGPDVADMWIADRIQPRDICVTGDIPLAARVIENGGKAIKHNGEAFTQANIGNALAMRDLMTDLRAANPLNQGGGNKGFTKQDRSRFLDNLDRMIRASLRER
jgi:uncharacterized protein YaiI (UPF0178 family)